MLNIFQVLKKISSQDDVESCNQQIGKLWLIAFDFKPWKKDGTSRCVIDEVGIESARAVAKGTLITSAYLHLRPESPFYGYLNRIEPECEGWWTGFFESKEAAKKAYAEMMLNWISSVNESIAKICGKNIQKETEI